MILFTVWFMRAVEPAVRRPTLRRRRPQHGARKPRRVSNSSRPPTPRPTRPTASRPPRSSTSSARCRSSGSTTSTGRGWSFAGLAFAATFAVGGYWLSAGPPGPFSTTLTVGTFVTFVLLTQQFVAPLAEVSNIIDQYENAKASCERVFGLRDIPIRITDGEDAIDLGEKAAASPAPSSTTTSRSRLRRERSRRPPRTLTRR